MTYPSIRVEGAILSPDILGQIEDLPGQKPSDFGLDSGTRVKDEIARCWADAQDYWRIFQRKLETVREGSNATTETRNLWMVPLMGLLRYDIEYQSRGTQLDGRIYAISHRATNRANTPVQIIGARDPAGLDKKPANATRRMSAHALVQEFLNLHDQLYGLVTDGQVLRLLRDSSRLVKQSYLEFDLDRIFTDGLFADFAVLYRMLHATRLPLANDKAAESLIERYHQDSLDQGARIRDGLSNAVEKAILDFANGFLKHTDNEALRGAVTNGELSSGDYYRQLLRLIYRLLFLLVIEERDLVFPASAPRTQRDIHRESYSVRRLRRLSEQRYLADPRRHDLWLALQACFRLFEANGPGAKLGIAPLAGDLFAPDALGSLAGCTLGNDVLLGCLRSLGLYRHPDSGQLIRVNYAALNVEEFGSVYEGLLEYQPEFVGEGRELRFRFRQGDERATTGSHYTPDDLVQPLIRHSLDHLIAKCLKAEAPEAALLKLRVADIACGSGHILLAAARRIATALAVVRTGEEQPSPSAYRTALRDAIRQCIYGVDVNPLAVELCKVALWLEAHIPGQPLNFLDHHIKCGNAIVGLARREELDQGVPTEAFKTLPGDDKEVAASYRKRNKEDLKQQKQTAFDFTPNLHGHLDAILEDWRQLSALPESTPAQIDEKKEQFATFAQGQHAGFLRTIADIPVAQFFVSKTPVNDASLVTDGEFRGYWQGWLVPQGPGVDAARTLAEQKRFFHWFLEFPEIMDRGGFDCILGNPPYLGGSKIGTQFGPALFQWLKTNYAPTGGRSDLVAYFVRRIFSLLTDSGFAALIATNTISQGDTRKGALQQIIDESGTINYAAPSVRWPGKAAVQVSLVSLCKGAQEASFIGSRSVESINSYLDDSGINTFAYKLPENAELGFLGSSLYGEGFVLEPAEAKSLCAMNPANSDVIAPYLIGRDLNNHPEQSAERYVINFLDWSRERASKYTECFQILTERVKPFRDPIVAAGKQVHEKDYWKFWDKRLEKYAALRHLDEVLVVSRVSKTLGFTFVPRDQVFADTVAIFPFDDPAYLAILQSNIHYFWIWRYCTTMKTDPIYGPSNVLQNFPFPRRIEENNDLRIAGRVYHEHRKGLMRFLWIGLTKAYNLFHARDLSPEMVGRVSKKDADTAAAGVEALLELRRLHVALDFAVRDSYGWKDLDLEHDFHEVATLPVKHRVRYTISPAARREVLKRLLAENHARSGAVSKDLVAKPKRDSRRRMSVAEGPGIFSKES